MAQLGLDGLLVPRSDAFLGEYVPASAERLAWLTGFTGSAGLALVLRDRAFLFVDGRYTTQAAREVDPALWTLRHLIEQPPAETLRAEAKGSRIGYDPWLHTEAQIERLTASGAELVPLEANPVDAVWTGRPAPPSGPAIPHPIAFAGVEAGAKREEAAAELRQAGEDAAVLADPHSVAWLLNMRGGDLAHTPLALAQAVLLSDGRVELFLDPSRADAALRAHLGNAVALRPPSEFGTALDALQAGGAVTSGLLDDFRRRPVDLVMNAGEYLSWGQRDPLDPNRISAPDLSAAGITGTLSIGLGARVLGDPGANLSFGSLNQLTVLGSLVAQGGKISLSIDTARGGYAQNPGFVSDGNAYSTAGKSIWLGPDSLIDVSGIARSEEHTSELHSRETISYAVFCLKKKKKKKEK